MNIDIFSNQNLWVLPDYLFWFTQIKMTILKDLKLEYKQPTKRYYQELQRHY